MTTKAALIVIAIVVYGMNYVASTVGIDLVAQIVKMF